MLFTPFSLDNWEIILLINEVVKSQSTRKSKNEN